MYLTLTQNVLFFVKKSHFILLMRKMELFFGQNGLFGSEYVEKGHENESKVITFNGLLRTCKSHNYKQ